MDASGRAAEAVERRAAWVTGSVLGLTLLLLIPLFAMGSEEDAPLDPGGEVFDLRDVVADRFSPAIFDVLFVVEARSGDVLTASVLAELSENLGTLRESDAGGGLAAGDLEAQPYLFPSFIPETGEHAAGGFTFVDGVEEALAELQSPASTLAEATDEEVKLAIHAMLANPATAGLEELLAVGAERETQTVYGTEIDSWSSPALLLQIGADNERLGGGLPEIVVGGDSAVLDRERLQRNMQALLRGDEATFRLWGVGVDANLQAQDDGERAGPFIMLTVIAVLAMVGIALRSYWAVALTGGGLGILMIWLKGGANLVGIQGGLVVDLIVPIAMISLGVDVAIHALRRYQEERRHGVLPRQAFRVGFAGVLSALTLAMLTGVAAFLSNVTSPIAAVGEFGAATAMAVVAAFVVLGIAVPLVMTHVDELRRRTQTATGATSSGGRVWPILGGVGVAASSGTGVIVLVAVDELAGVLLILGSIALTVGVPLAALHWRAAHVEPGREAAPETQAVRASGLEVRWIEFLMTGVGRHRWIVAATAAAITAGAMFFALRLDAGMDVQELFSRDSDFVTGLNKLDEHLSQHQREAAHILVEGDLSEPSALAAIREVKEQIGGHPHVLRGLDGEARFEPDIFTVLSGLLESTHALNELRAVSGVELAYATGDGLPGSAAEARAIFDYVVEHGVPIDSETTLLDAAFARQLIAHEPGGSEQAIVLTVPIVGTRAPETVRAAQRDLETALELLDAEPSIRSRGVTGPAFTRQASLDATTASLQRSFPLAVVSVFLLLLLAMRSWRYAIVTIIPIGLVAAWLYGFMGLAGFNLNIVTATIGAVSIGIGIDFAIHVTERYREELARRANAMEALTGAARGTGVALMASAASSVAGFMIMAFAPMPLFATYGLLTALMILLAVSASLLVLPALLLIVTPRRHFQDTPR